MLRIGIASPQPGFPPVEKSCVDDLAGACDCLRQDSLLQSREWVFDLTTWVLSHRGDIYVPVERQSVLTASSASEVYLDFPDPTDAVEELSKALRT
eukprot:4761152-Prymnesium_polylepis.1